MTQVASQVANILIYYLLLQASGRSYSMAHKSPHLSYTHFQLNQEIDIRDVNVLALDVAKTSHERS
jgi:hypothetical protein